MLQTLLKLRSCYPGGPVYAIRPPRWYVILLVVTGLVTVAASVSRWTLAWWNPVAFARWETPLMMISVTASVFFLLGLCWALRYRRILSDDQR